MKRIIFVILFYFVCGLTEAFGETLATTPMDVIGEIVDLNEYAMLTADEDTLEGTSEDYAVIVMAKGDICILFVLNEEDDSWIVESNTRLRTRLYPLLSQNRMVTVSKTGDGQFSLIWPEETYTFTWIGTSWRLTQAKFTGSMGNCKAIWEENETGFGMKFQDKDTEILWQQGMGLVNFNPMLFPKNCSEVKRQNAILSVLDCIYIDDLPDTDILGNRFKLYTMPNQKSALIDTHQFTSEEKFHLYGLFDDWAFISYQIGYEHTYYGYVKKSRFSFSKVEISNLKSSFSQCPLQICEDTYLTDDPLLSQEPVHQLSSGTDVVGLCIWDASYAYVEVNVDQNVVRGFVPLNVLALIPIV